jgi:hypothetical protein
VSLSDIPAGSEPLFARVITARVAIAVSGSLANPQLFTLTMSYRAAKAD